MTDSEPTATEGSGRPSRLSTTLLAGCAVIILALTALVLPRTIKRNNEQIFLVFDPHSQARLVQVYQPLTTWLEDVSGESLRLQIVSERADFQLQATADVRFVFCPDGAALGLASLQFSTLAFGRRPPPHNLRPRSVLVYRKAAGLITEPWFSVPERTVFGDSISLVGFGAVCRQAQDQEGSFAAPQQSPDWTFGPDPYDHSPVLHAARLGCFDYAVVRQWTADIFFTYGLLPTQDWGVEDLSVPVPDLVLLVARSLSTTDRMQLGESLLALGRRDEDLSEHGRAALAGLEQLGLAGFNILLEPDFELVRRRFDRCWPRNDN